MIVQLKICLGACVVLCLTRKLFLKKRAGHWPQLYCGFRARETARWRCFRCTSNTSFSANRSPQRLHLQTTTRLTRYTCTYFAMAKQLKQLNKVHIFYFFRNDKGVELFPILGVKKYVFVKFVTEKIPLLCIPFHSIKSFPRTMYRNYE